MLLTVCLLSFLRRFWSAGPLIMHAADATSTRYYAVASVLHLLTAGSEILSVASAETAQKEAQGDLNCHFTTRTPHGIEVFHYLRSLP
jgi:hypothetical protein